MGRPPWRSTLAILLLSSREASRARHFAAGLAASAMVVIRPVDIVFAATIGLWVARHRPRRLGWFLPMPFVMAMALIVYNYWFFGTIKGGYQALDGGGVLDPWKTSLRDGLLGTLFSPNRGLFLFCPWVALALMTLPATAPKLARNSLVAWLLVALIPYLLVLSKYTNWWGGFSFGLRFWADAVPLFTIVLGFGLDWARFAPTAR